MSYFSNNSTRVLCSSTVRPPVVDIILVVDPIISSTPLDIRPAILEDNCSVLDGDAVSGGGESDDTTTANEESFGSTEIIIGGVAELSIEDSASLTVPISSSLTFSSSDEEIVLRAGKFLMSFIETFHVTDSDSSKVNPSVLSSMITS